MTDKLRKQKNLLLVLQLLLMLGTVAALVVSTIVGLEPSEGSLKEQYGTVLTSLAISVTIVSGLLIVVGHKVRGTIWMASLLLASYLYGNLGMWIVFAIWGVDEYVVFPLYKHKKTELTASKVYDKAQLGKANQGSVRTE